MSEDVGFQDQCASAFGGLVLIETEEGQINPRKFITSPDYQHHFEDSILLGYDGTPRYSGNTSKITKASIRDTSNISNLNELSDICNEGITQFSKMADMSKHAELTKLSRDIKLRLSDNSMIPIRIYLQLRRLDHYAYNGSWWRRLFCALPHLISILISKVLCHLSKFELN